ncbi:MAG: family 10 glycosylhydrolase [Symploca sp. SIO3C6]|nr:family 10 glycosylhydrolase [Symploca sp. SIO3C6]NET08121.1 family 10 glycosylhydrolase [Symploca sp. SIO2B6]
MVASLLSFPDIQEHWARSYIEGLATKSIISGFPDGSFRPDLVMNRAQFAAVLKKAFPKSEVRPKITFIDVPERHWAASAIQKVYETGFMSGYPGSRFRPEAKITRVEALIALISGLDLTSEAITDATVSLRQLYQDAEQIPVYARERVAIASEAQIVVNYPEAKLLRPLEAATRAEVAAFIYQALVYLDEELSPKTEGIVIEQETVAVSHQREFRGVWVASAWNSDWPSRQGLPSATQQQELIKMLEQLQELKFNALIFQIRPTADALYVSQLEPWSEWITGVQGEPPEPLYDPLELAIAQAHKRNIEVHAWFNPFRARTSTKGSPNVKPHIALAYPQFVYQYGSALWMDPGIKVIQDWTYEVILDVVRRYDLDGVHLDDYFYPYPRKDEPFPDQKTYEAYRQAGGKLSLADWRRANVNQMVERLSSGVHSLKPQIKFGISPFGIYRPGQPPQIRGFDQYQGIYADPKKWLAEGWVDYMSPQLYWRIEPIAQSYPLLLDWWTDNNPQGRHIYPGNALYKMEREDWPLSEYQNQVEITRQLASELSLGNIFFNMKVLGENRLGIFDYFQTSLYAEPALPPVMEWLGDNPPAVPSGVGVSGDKLVWEAATSEDIRSWTIYRQTGGSWKLYKILTAANTEVKVELGTYAVCAVDRMANESEGVVISR